MAGGVTQAWARSAWAALLVLVCGVPVAAQTPTAGPAGGGWPQVCTDAQGRTTVQPQACTPLPPQPANGPVLATQLSAAGAREAVRRFRASLTARDAATATSHLAPVFSATIQTASGTSSYDRASFADLVTRVLQAASAYRSVARCAPPVIDGEVAVLRCEVQESMTLLGRSQSGQSSDEHTLSLVDGAVRLVAIRSVQR